MHLRKITLGALVAGAALTVASAAAASTIIVNENTIPVVGPPGHITDLAIPGGKAYSAANTYYFAFTLASESDWQSYLDVSYALKTTKKPPAPQPPKGSFDAPLSYSLYEGTCTKKICTPAKLIDSTTPGDQRLFDTLAKGSYFLELNSVTLPTLKSGWSYALGPSLSGQLTTAAVPEPSEWALLLLGVAGTGAALRRRRQAALA